MEASGGWTVISTEENNNAIVPDLNSNVSSIENYFEAIGELERKCRLCSTTVKVTPKSKWNIKRHFKAKHSIEWAQMEGVSATRKSQVRYMKNSDQFLLCARPKYLLVFLRIILVSKEHQPRFKHT